MSPDVFPLDILFEWGSTDKKPTVAIGDGGNELGMGKVTPKHSIVQFRLL